MDKKFKDYSPPKTVTIGLLILLLVLVGVLYGINDYVKRDYNRKAGERVEKIEVVPTPKGLDPTDIKSPPIKIDVIPICWNRVPGKNDYEYSVLVVTRTSRPTKNGYVEILNESTSVVPVTFGSLQNVKSAGIPSCF